MRIISRKLRSELSRPMEAIKDSNGRRAASFIKFTIDHQVLTNGWNICASDVTFKLIIHRNWIMPFLSPSVFQRWAIDSGRLIEWTSPLNLTRIRPVHFGPIGRRWMTEATRLTCTNVHNRFHCGYWSINLVISPSTVQRTKSEKKSQDTRQDTKRWKEAFIVKQKHDGIDLPVFSAYLKKKEKKRNEKKKKEMRFNVSNLALIPREGPPRTSSPPSSPCLIFCCCWCSPPPSPPLSSFSVIHFHFLKKELCWQLNKLRIEWLIWIWLWHSRQKFVQQRSETLRRALHYGRTNGWNAVSTQFRHIVWYIKPNWIKNFVGNMKSNIFHVFFAWFWDSISEIYSWQFQ